MKTDFSVIKVANGYILVAEGGQSNSGKGQTYIAADADALQQSFITHLVKKEMQIEEPPTVFPKKKAPMGSKFMPYQAPAEDEVDEILKELDA